jgi:hypothetical protein
MNDAARQTDLYEGIWQADPSYGTAECDVTDTVLHRIGPHMQRLFDTDLQHVVDFGAGDGRFLKALMAYGYAHHGTGVDLHMPPRQPHMSWVQLPMWAMLNVRSGYVISTDALEHLPPDRVPDALASIALTAPHGFLRISLKEDRYGTDRGLHLHESVFPASEWLRLLRDARIEPTSYRVYFDADRVEAAIEVYF